MKKMKPSERREAEKWKATVLFLCGIPVAKIAEDARVGLTIGSIHRLVADRKLQDKRSSYDERLLALVLLHREAPAGLSAFIESALTSLNRTTDIVSLGSMSSIYGQKVSATEAMNRKRLLRDFRSEISREPVRQEAITIPEKVGKQTVTRNIANCPLEFLLSRALIPQWAYDSGLALRRDFDAATIGGLKAFNPMKDTVDGGFPSNTITEGQASALERLGEARAAIRATCHASDLSGVWRVLEAAAIQGRGVGEWIDLVGKDRPGGIKARKRQRHIAWLMFGLERVAFVYDLCPAGEVNAALASIKRANNGRLRPMRKTDA